MISFYGKLCLRQPRKFLSCSPPRPLVRLVITHRPLDRDKYLLLVRYAESTLFRRTTTTCRPCPILIFSPKRSTLDLNRPRLALHRLLFGRVRRGQSCSQPSSHSRHLGHDSRTLGEDLCSTGRSPAAFGELNDNPAHVGFLDACTA